MRAVLLLIAAFSLAACEPEIRGGEPAAAAAPATEAPANAAPTLNGVDLTQPLSLIGTEPFWAVKTSEREVVFSSPENQSGRPFTAASFHVEGGAAHLNAGELEVTLTAGPCSDGMSDRVYPLTAQVKLDGQTLSGCAMTTAQLEATRP